MYTCTGFLLSEFIIGWMDDCVDQVRVTAMVKGITGVAVDEVPAHVLSYLEKLITDGNFFRTDFLYGFEKSLLEFDQ